MKDWECTYFTYRVKCVTAVVLYFWALILFFIGIAICSQWSGKISKYELNGGDFLPMLRLDYHYFADDMIKSGLGCIVLSILAVFTGRCKNKYLSWVYPIVAMCVAGLMSSASNSAIEFEPATLELYD